MEIVSAISSPQFGHGQLALDLALGLVLRRDDGLNGDSLVDREHPHRGSCRA